jgi:glycosyl transferase family 87
MTLQTLPLRQGLRPAASDMLRRVCFGLVVANVAYLVAQIVGRNWILDGSGHPIHTDFTSVYAAGRLVLEGHPAAAYDWNLHYAAENAVVAHSQAAYLGWHYPPPFLLIAGLLATLPYAVAFFVWIATTLPLYLATLRAIVGDRIGWLVAGAFPCLMPNIISGQNGFLTASLVGGALVLLDSQPLFAGICLGLLTYKPQFGILFPLVLAAGGYWRTMATAAASAVALALATIVLFGTTPWTEFFHWLPLTSNALLSQDHTAWADHTEWNKFQSLFAMVRLLGGGATLAWALQAALAAAAAIVLCAMWRSKHVAFELKAAGLAVGVLFATPYVYLYDLTILAVACAFLIRLATKTGFLPGETLGLALIVAALLMLPFLGVPVGLPTEAIASLLIGRRVRDALAGTAITQPI